MLSLSKYNNCFSFSKQGIFLGGNEVPFNSYIVKEFGESIAIVPGGEFEKRYVVTDKIRPLSMACVRPANSEDEIIIKSCGSCTQIFINGVEMKWVQDIKFTHNARELATLEIKRVI